jgi:hypothetical protein
MEDVGIFYAYLVYFVVIWYILWSFSIPMLWQFGIFFPFESVVQGKIWQPRLGMFVP